MMAQLTKLQAPVDSITFTPVVLENSDSGLKLSGIIYKPKGVAEDEKLPAVLVQGPMGSVKEQTQSLYAQVLASKGYMAMVYDYSYLGASEGEPRGLEDPVIKASDIKSAADFLYDHPNTDQNRFFAVGICGSGVYLPLALVTYKKFVAAASVNPFTIINTVETMSREAALADKTEYEKTGKAARMDLIEPGSEGAEYYFNYERGAAVNRVVFPTWSQLDWQAYDPLETVKDVTTPYLIIAGENAFTRPGAEVMFNNLASTDKKLVIIPEARHFDLYDLEAYVPQVVEQITQFFSNK